MKQQDLPVISELPRKPTREQLAQLLGVTPDDEPVTTSAFLAHTECNDPLSGQPLVRYSYHCLRPRLFNGGYLPQPGVHQSGVVEASDLRLLVADTRELRIGGVAQADMAPGERQRVSQLLGVAEDVGADERALLERATEQFWEAVTAEFREKAQSLLGDEPITPAYMHRVLDDNVPLDELLGDEPDFQRKIAKDVLATTGRSIEGEAQSIMTRRGVPWNGLKCFEWIDVHSVAEPRVQRKSGGTEAVLPSALAKAFAPVLEAQQAGNSTDRDAMLIKALNALVERIEQIETKKGK